MKKIALISCACLFIDQLIKYLINEMVPLERSLSMIGDFFQITYIRNYGAAFNMFTGNRMFLIVIALATLCFLYYFLIKDSKNNLLEQLGYGLFVGGILGNLVDRILNGYVIDYLDFKLFGMHMPIFNYADICICVGVCFCIIAFIKEEQHGRNQCK